MVQRENRQGRIETADAIVETGFRQRDFKSEAPRTRGDKERIADQDERGNARLFTVQPSRNRDFGPYSRRVA
jgi:hypothetical protein